MRLVQLGGQRSELGLGSQRGLGVIGAAHPGGHHGAQFLGQLVPHVSDLVELAATDHRPVEHVAHRAAQRLPTRRSPPGSGG
jgi:hypothetical protein